MSAFALSPNALRVLEAVFGAMPRAQPTLLNGGTAPGQLRRATPSCRTRRQLSQ